jgi:protein tyrosine/serine phosphatase
MAQGFGVDTEQVHAAGPVYVHCRKGHDRTGVVIACFRIAHDGWSNEKAIQSCGRKQIQAVENSPYRQ